MMLPGAESLRKIAVVGRGTAGSLAAASVARLHPDGDHELHHIYDSRIPVIGVGEGSWPSLVQELRRLTDLPHETVQQRLNGTRKYGVAFEGWGRRNRDFTHYFTPQQVSYAYHLSADTMAELLHESTRARHIDAKVLGIARVEGGARVEFEGRAPERYDLVFDARGFPRELHPDRHIDISFIPTNTAVIRRCPAVITAPPDGPVVQHTYTRAVARPHGWIFVIPLTVHTSYGYIFNRDVTSLAEVESDFDTFLETDGVSEFEQRAVIPFPNFVHRRMYDGAVARVGNAAAFMEPLEATAIVSAQLADRDGSPHTPQPAPWSISSAMRRWSTGSSSTTCSATACSSAGTIPAAPGTTANSGVTPATTHGHDTARPPTPRRQVAPRCANSTTCWACSISRSSTEADRDRMCAVPLTSYAQMSQGLGC